MVTVMGVTAYYKINPTEISITQNMLRELIWSAMLQCYVTRVREDIIRIKSIYLNGAYAPLGLIKCCNQNEKCPIINCFLYNPTRTFGLLDLLDS